MGRALGISELVKASGERSDAAGFPHSSPLALKAMLHMAIIEALDGSGYLDSLVFQGGSCLSEVYGSTRLSEDLDFAAGSKSNLESFSDLGDCIGDALSGLVDARVNVKAPDLGKAMAKGLPVARWVASVDLTPDDPSSPLERVKVELACVDARDTVIEFPNPPIASLAGGFEDIPMPVESRDELLADKLVSFAHSSHPRTRDVWDASWLLGHGADLEGALGLLPTKLGDYGYERTGEAFRDAGARVMEAFAEAERSQLALQLPTDVAGRTVRRERWALAAMARVSGALYRAADALDHHAASEGGAQSRDEASRFDGIGGGPDEGEFDLEEIISDVTPRTAEPDDPNDHSTSRDRA